MKQLFKIGFVFLGVFSFFIAPTTTYATYGLTKSLYLVSASSQYARKTGPTGMPTGSAARTLEAWVKTTTTSEMTAFVVGDNTVGDRDFGIQVSNGTIGVRTQGSNQFWTATNVNDGNWHHLAISYPASTAITNSAVKAYMDGVSLTSASTFGAGTVNTVDSTLTIGAGSETVSPTVLFNGAISLVRIWDTNQSQATIQAEMCVVYGTATTNMVFEASLDNVYTDASGNGNTLTAVNSPVFVTDTAGTSTCAVAAPPPANQQDFMTFN